MEGNIVSTLTFKVLMYSVKYNPPTEYLYITNKPVRLGL